MIRKNQYCVGCMACVSVCPTKSICEHTNKYGEIRPIVDKKKCVGCGICDKVCFLNQKLDLKYPKACFAVNSKNNKIHRNSSSGGFLYEISMNFIKNDGVVYGVTYSDDFTPIYREGTNEKDIISFTGSKYSTVYINNIYSSVKNKLIEGKKVLFIGVPCIVSALKGYLGKEYGNLLTIDLFCSGEPSLHVMKKYVQAIVKKYNITAFDDIKMRGKRGFSFCILKDDIAVYRKGINDDLYWRAYQEIITLERKCFRCEFRVRERIGDISVGDFWGIKDTKSEYHNGVNCVLINTSKGMEEFDMCKDKIDFELKELNEAFDGGYALTVGNINRPFVNRIFYFFLNKLDILHLLKLCLTIIGK